MMPQTDYGPTKTGLETTALPSVSWTKLFRDLVGDLHANRSSNLTWTKSVWAEQTWIAEMDRNFPPQC
jgi:hypothetical protein